MKDSSLSTSDTSIIVFCTGHRPDYLGGYDDSVLQGLTETAKRALMELKPDRVIVGGALGWDTACALACIELNIPYVLAVPFIGQESKWPEKSQKMYRHTVDCADEVIHVCEPGYAAWKMLERNKWMADNGNLGLCIYDEAKPVGGTAHCVKYALGAGKPMWNAWGIHFMNKPTLTTISPNIFDTKEKESNGD